MKYKKCLLFICVIICLFSIVSVSASDSNEQVLSENQNEDIIKMDNQDELVSSNIKENVLSIDEQNGADSNPDLTKLSTKITVKNIKGYQNKKVKLTATVKDQNGKKVNKGAVIFKFKGKTYKVKIKNGKAVKTIKIPKTNNRDVLNKFHKGKVTEVYGDEYYKGKVSFLADSNYLASSSTFKVTTMKKSKTKKYTPTYMSEETGEISHKKPKITKKKTIKHRVKVGKYKGKLTNKQYKKLKKAYKKNKRNAGFTVKVINNKRLKISVQYMNGYSPQDEKVYKKGFYASVWYITRSGDEAVKVNFKKAKVY